MFIRVVAISKSFSFDSVARLTPTTSKHTTIVDAYDHFNNRYIYMIIFLFWLITEIKVKETTYYVVIIALVYCIIVLLIYVHTYMNMLSSHITLYVCVYVPRLLLYHKL